MLDAKTETSQRLQVLSEDQAEFFAAHGYLIVGRLLSDEHLKLIRHEYDAEIAKGRETGHLENVGNEQKQWYLLQFLSSLNIYFRQLVYHDGLLDIAEDLMGPNIQLLYDEAFYKPGKVGSQVNVHRDNTDWQCHPATAITCWLTLDDVDVDNGAMHVYPGSHLQPRAEESEYDPDSAVACKMSAGSVMFHHCWTLHYSTPNVTDQDRRALGIHLIAPGTRSPIVNLGGKKLLTHPILRMQVY